MVVVIASGTTVAVAANTKSADLVSGQFENLGPGKVTLFAFPSATGLNATCSVGGISMIDDLPSPYFGATGSMTASDHVIASQKFNGGRVQLFFRNTTGGALTVDYLLLYEPGR